MPINREEHDWSEYRRQKPILWKKHPLRIPHTWLSHRLAQDRPEVRRALRCKWGEEEPSRWLAWLMINPSYATDEGHDPTTKRVTYFTQHWPSDEPYDGWIAVNLYPLVSSNTGPLWSEVEREENESCIQANLRDIEKVSKMARQRVLGYGFEPIKRKKQPWVDQCLNALGRAGGDESLWCLGLTDRDRQPRHPGPRGHVPRDLPLAVFQYERAERPTALKQLVDVAQTRLGQSNCSLTKK